MISPTSGGRGGGGVDSTGLLTIRLNSPITPNFKLFGKFDHSIAIYCLSSNNHPDISSHKVIWHLFSEFPDFPEFRNSTEPSDMTSLPRSPIFPGNPEFYRAMVVRKVLFWVFFSHFPKLVFLQCVFFSSNLKRHYTWVNDFSPGTRER